ncbi:HTH domain-containing protein [Listeria booriae]|uniref:helix-turn-helix domain-containing protein n=1 Tax=Listeria booriae TaxID=1552123 RepID=UPI00162A6577|nr:helix-turn-helix domain-containing protein [Listeria booriae]MBC1531186.1 HTH domain-containing protein [Listeria booriae]MBC6134186.1 HTH domain-containing protein [Listeria booriae]
MFYIENLFELEKNLGRYVNILKILSERSGWFSCHFLAKKLNCSEKTVRRNIQEMNSQFPINWFIQSEVRKGVQLQKPMNESIYPIYRRFFQNTITYQILEAIYYEKHHNVTEIAEDLFISVPVAYKLINMLEKNLATLQLSISKKPIKLVGDEENVRLFYYYIFSDIGDYNAFFPEDELKRIVHYVQQIEAQEKITLSPAEQHWIIRVFFNHVPITFEQAENIGQTMLETKTFLSLIQELEHEFGIDLQHDPLFLDMMIQNVEYEHVPNLKHDYLFLQDHRMQEFILENYFNTYLQVKKIYNYFDAQSAIYQIGTTRNIMDTVIFMITKKVYALTQKAKVCVLVTSRGDIWSNFLKTLIENHFGSRIVIREVSSIFKIDASIWKDADFIIADFDFKYNHVPNIIIDPIPSQRDFENIERFLVTKEMKLSEVD